MERPKRKYVLEMEAGADDIRSLIGELNATIQAIREGHFESVSGGASCSSHYKITVDPDMTNEKYFELLDRWDRVRDGQPQ